MNIKAKARPTPVLAIHGGAGTLLRGAMSPAKEQHYRLALEGILIHGQAQLASGAPALDVVVEAVRRLEECELFNAGKGAVYTADARHELDACVMDGRELRAGAVAGVTRTRNPVLLARQVMERSPHLMFVGAAADELARGFGLEMVEPDWFGTPERLAQLHKAQQQVRGQMLDHDGQTLAAGGGPIDEQSKFGTVGAVALDAQGHLAAATSTGGMTNKQPGRVGDSPIVGAGCYANDATVAISCTGTGEAFIRACAAHDISALIEYAGLSLDAACERVVMDKLPRIDGRGGLIAVSAKGEVCLPFNTEGMYRGQMRVGDAAPQVGIYGDAQ